MAMKIRVLCLVVALFAGCTSHRPMGAAVDNDRNVLTGGPITGTTLQDLPKPVRRALRRDAPKSEVANIRTSMQDGKTVYEISFTQPDRDPKMYFTADGKLVSQPDLQK